MRTSTPHTPPRRQPNRSSAPSSSLREVRAHSDFIREAIDVFGGSRVVEHTWKPSTPDTTARRIA